MAKTKDFFKVGQTSKVKVTSVKNFGTHEKVLSKGTYTCNMKALPLLVWKLWPKLKFFLKKVKFQGR